MGDIYYDVYEVVSPSGYRCAIFHGANAENRAWQYVLHNAPRATSGEYSRVIKHGSYTMPDFPFRHDPFPCDIPIGPDDSTPQ